MGWQYPYWITVEFDIEYLTIISVPVQISLQLVLRFNNDDVNETKDAETQGCHMKSYGTLVWEYDFDEPLLVPGNLRLTIFDTQGYLANYLMPDPSTEAGLDPRAEVIFYVGGATSIEFRGQVIEDSVRYNEGTKELIFEAAPRMDIINKQMVYDLDNGVVNPFSYTFSSHYPFVTYLEDIFGLVNSSISYPTSLKIYHDWEFGGNPLGGGAGKEDFVLTDLRFLVDYFYNSPGLMGIKNCGDLLRQWAFTFGCYCGMITDEYAFFKQLFRYDSGNTQSLQDVIEVKWFNNYGLIDYVRVHSVTGTAVEAYNDYGTETNLEGRYMDVDNFGYFFEYNASAFSQTYAISGGTYAIWRAYNAALFGSSPQASLGIVTSKFWQNYRGYLSNMLVKEFTVTNVLYDFDKDFSYDGENFQIIRLEKIFDLGISKILAVRIN